MNLNDPIACCMLPLFASYGVMLACWRLGMRPFLHRHGVTPSEGTARSGSGMIEDAIHVLKHCRGRCPLPLSFWCYLCGMIMGFVSLLTVMLAFLLWK